MQNPLKPNQALAFVLCVVVSQLIAVGFWALEVFELDPKYYITRYERIEILPGFLLVGLLVGLPIGVIVYIFDCRNRN